MSYKGFIKKKELNITLFFVIIVIAFVILFLTLNVKHHEK
jgi:hypothetical protein